MPVWEQYEQSFAITTLGSHSDRELFHNIEDTDNFQNAPVTVVDGIVTVDCPNDSFWSVRLLVTPQEMDAGDLSPTAQGRTSPLIYYHWYCSRGPLIFRLRSKRTIPIRHKLWMQGVKVFGDNATQEFMNVGLQIFLVLNH